MALVSVTQTALEMSDNLIIFSASSRHPLFYPLQDCFPAVCLISPIAY